MNEFSSLSNASPSPANYRWILVAAAYVAAPLFKLFGNLGQTLNTVLVLASLVVGIPFLFRRLHSGTGRQRVKIALVVVCILVIYALVNALVNAMLPTVSP